MNIFVNQLMKNITNLNCPPIYHHLNGDKKYYHQLFKLSPCIHNLLKSRNIFDTRDIIMGSSALAN